jgi:hypothetical protein
MDTFRTLQLDVTLLEDDKDHVNGLDDGRDHIDETEADGTLGVITGSTGQQYTVFWNVRDNTDTNTKTVRLFVYWTDQKFGLNRVIVTSVLGGLYL